MRLRKDKIPVYQLTRSEWKKLSQDKEPEGIIAIVKNKEQPSLSSLFKSAAGHILILHEINNPGNLGALMRSALWFGFAGYYFERQLRGLHQSQSYSRLHGQPFSFDGFV